MTTDGPNARADVAAPDRRALYGLGAGVSAGLGIWMLGVAARSNPSAPPSPLTFGVIIGAFAIAIGCFIALLNNAHRVRSAKLARAAHALGMQPATRLTRDEKPAVFGAFAGLTMLRSGAKGVRFHSAGTYSGRRVDLIEHSYVISTGKSTQTVNHTVAATPCPPAWPRLSLTPRGVLGKLWESIAGRDLQVESAAFNDRWTIKTDNPDFAILFLSPEVQEFLSSAPAYETWHVADGSVCWVARRTITPEALREPVDRVVALRNRLPAELDFWGS